MKKAVTTTICSGAILFTAPLSFAERSFTSSDGRKLAAEIIAATGADVTLKKKDDGKEYTIPLSRLSEDDQRFVAVWLDRKKVNTRAVREITLSAEGGKTETLRIPEGEYFDKDGVLTLYPGDTVHLEFSEKDGRLVQPEIIAEVTEPKRTITFSMSQDGRVTMLSRETKIRQTVAMDCAHRGFGNDDFFRTNLRPTEKGLASFDSWPGTVWTLRLSNIEVSDRPAEEVYMERAGK